MWKTRGRRASGLCSGRRANGVSGLEKQTEKARK